LPCFLSPLPPQLPKYAHQGGGRDNGETGDRPRRSIATSVNQQDAATAEIARNVDRTANAAQEMTNRNADVSSAAAGTSRHVVDLRDNTAGLGQ
jgi:methyl-accepting chemotaxis protein